MMNKVIPAVDELNWPRNLATIASTFSIASKTRKMGKIRIGYLDLVKEKKC
jgi:hypothetical protein